MAKSAALQFKVSKMVSTSRMSAPPSSKPRTCSEYEVASSARTDVASERVVDRRDAGRAVGGSDGAGDVARLRGIFRSPALGCLLGDLGRSLVQFVHLIEPSLS